MFTFNIFKIIIYIIYYMNKNYFCKLCNYTTDSVSRFNRHAISTSHNEKNRYSFYCCFCNLYLKNIKSYNTHKYNQHTKKIIIDNTTNKTKNKIKDRSIKNNSDKMDIIIQGQEEIKEEINKSKQEVKEVVTKAITKASSLIKYLMENHKYVPPIKKLTDKESIKTLRIEYNILNNTKKDYLLEKKIINDYINNTDDLIKLLAKTILNMVNHKKPEKQQIYNTDSSRYNYVIKLRTKKWDEDKAGIQFTVKNNKNIFLLFLMLGIIC
jgi:hypothetical protein